VAVCIETTSERNPFIFNKVTFDNSMVSIRRTNTAYSTI
jgi:hypothetical protein